MVHVRKFVYYFLVAFVFLTIGYLKGLSELPPLQIFSEAVAEEMQTGNQKFAVGNLTFVPTKKPNVWLVAIKHEGGEIK